jgi:protein-disulfide isomerase
LSCALAARAQDKYLAMHNTLMAHNGRLSEEIIFNYAGKLGLDVDQLRAEMQSEAVSEVIAANRSLAQSLNITGTPAFIIGDKLYPGAMPLAKFEDAIAAARG